MRNWLKNPAVIALLLLVYGGAIFFATRAHYQQRAPVAAAPPAGSSAGIGMPIPQGTTREDPRLEAAWNDAPALSEIGDELFRDRRYAEAARVYRRAVDLDPSDVDSRNDLGLALHYLRRSAEAIAVLREGTRAAPDYQRIWLTLGFVLAAAGQFEDARSTLTKARDMGASNAIGQEANRLLEELSNQ